MFAIFSYEWQLDTFVFYMGVNSIIQRVRGFFLFFSIFCEAVFISKLTCQFSLFFVQNFVQTTSTLSKQRPHFAKTTSTLRKERLLILYE